eukprot:gb/GFBE01038131.1/.p1 GENE.gb/GFBE01038131.1/~~gb/GFBE01038131.1/.p1  ORF type:complete len:282 (+),score=74.69 gb/GFBE01038131.1/:1-846(+)
MASYSELEISPGFLEEARKQLSKLKVKNTFIDVIDSDDEEEKGPAFSALKSCPVWATDKESDVASSGPTLPLCPPLPRSVAESARQMPQPPCLLTSSPIVADQSNKSSDLSTKSFGMKSFKVKNTFIDGTDSDEDEDRPAMMKRMSLPCRPRVVQEHEPESPQAAASAAPTAAPAAVAIEPLERRRPAMSKGGQLHGTGNCKPCAWFWRPQGCSNGEECGHCHLCSAAELKARKKAKKSASQRVRAAAGTQVEQVQPNQPVQMQVLAMAPGPILVPTLMVQ